MARTAAALTRLRTLVQLQIKRIGISGTRKNRTRAPSARRMRKYIREDHDDRAEENFSRQDVQGSRLLGLPAELRHQIYQFVLCEEDDIEINDANTPSEPGLLGVNRQIRDEARDIYYDENRFHFTLTDYDASIFLKWIAASKKHADSDWRTCYRGACNWSNVKAWLKATHEGESNDHCPQASVEKRPSVVARTFRMLMKMKRNKVPWKEAESYLEDLRQILTLHNSAWGWTAPEE